MGVGGVGSRTKINGDYTQNGNHGADLDDANDEEEEKKKDEEEEEDEKEEEKECYGSAFH